MWFPSISSRVPKLINFIEALPARFEVPEKLKNLMATVPAKIDKMETPPRLKHFVSALSTKGTIQGATSGLAAGLTAIAVSGFFAIEDNCPAAENEIFSAALISLVTRVAWDVICNNETDQSDWTKNLISYGSALVFRKWIFGHIITEHLGNLIGSVVKTEYGVLAIGAGIAAKAIAESPLEDLLQLEDPKKSKDDKTDKKAETTGNKKASARRSITIPGHMLGQLLTMSQDEAKQLLDTHAAQPRSRKAPPKASEEKKRSVAEPQLENPFASGRQHNRGYVAALPSEVEGQVNDERNLFDDQGDVIGGNASRDSNYDNTYDALSEYRF